MELSSRVGDAMAALSPNQHVSPRRAALSMPGHGGLEKDHPAGLRASKWEEQNTLRQARMCGQRWTGLRLCLVPGRPRSPCCRVLDGVGGRGSPSPTLRQEGGAPCPPRTGRPDAHLNQPTPPRTTWTTGLGLRGEAGPRAVMKLFTGLTAQLSHTTRPAQEREWVKLAVSLASWDRSAPLRHTL